MTAYTFRLLVLLPAAQAEAYNIWVAANLDPEGGALMFTVGLNASGLASDPVTHYVACIALTAGQLKTVLDVLCAQAGIPGPILWESMSRYEQRDWTRDRAAAIGAALGIQALAVDDNDGVWSSYPDAIAPAGLKPISRE